MNSHSLPLLLAPLIIVLMGARVARSSSSRRLRLEFLWVMPAVMAVAALPLLAQTHLTAGDCAWLAGVAIIGAATGWVRGKTMRITIDPETHTLNQQASPAALLFLAGLILVRLVFRTVMQEQAAAWHLDPLFVTDIFLMLVLGMITAQRAEMAIRARRLLREVRDSPPTD